MVVLNSVNVCVLLVVITVSLLQGGTAYEVVGDLSALKDQFHSYLTELQSTDTTYDTSIATLLDKLDLLQFSPPSLPNVTLDWFNPPEQTSTNPPLRITMVVSSFEGMYLNSGIGTFYSSLADFLVQKGYSVTVLYTDTAVSDTPAFTRWKAQAEKRGLRAARLGAYPIHLRLSALAQRSYQVYEYLKNHQTEFDVVHFPDWEGPGYYSMLAKKDGMEFLSKLFIVGIHGPWRWVKSANTPSSTASPILTTSDDMETDWLERKSVEMADMAWSPSSDIVKWLEAQGWALPSFTYKMAYLPGREISQMKLNVKNTDDESPDVNELVFFGRMETRKGLELFADALDRLAVTRPEFAGTKITFLGRTANIGNQTATAYIDERFVKGAWPFKVVYIAHKDRKGALEYLREPTRVAVIPSIVDNTPYTVYECLFAKIPFIASNIPSISSIIATEDGAEVLFEPNAMSLAQKLENVLDNGARRAMSSLKLEDVEASWMGLYAKAYAMINEQRTTEKAKASATEASAPLISVCITHFNRPQFLQLALESVKAMTYSNFEVVLVDDGSTTQDAKDYLASLTREFNSKGWQLILSNNQYLGAARNKAAQHARGDYLFFLDDDNLVTPHTLTTYARVAARTHADILTAAHDVFEGAGKADEGTVVGRWVPLGASPALGIFKNCFGDANFFVRKSTFTALKGFTEDRDVGQEDHEFLAKAVLDGHSLVVVPEPLLAYRMHNQSEQMLYTTDSLRNALRAHRPYRSMMEESGIEITEAGFTSSPTKGPESLKLLAYSRAHSRQVFETCNLTVSNVVPRQIPSRTESTLTFTTAIRDCDIETIRIGDAFTCTIGNVQTSMFTCTTQRIPVPGSYPVFVKFTTENTLQDTRSRIVVTASPSADGSTTALANLAVYREAGMFNSNELMGLIAGIVPLPVDSLSVLSDTVTRVNNQKRDVLATPVPFVDDELHKLLFTITSRSPSAADAYNVIFNVLRSNPKIILPYRFESLSLNGVCSASGECSCGPLFEGPGCVTPSKCPKDCSGNGNCTIGTNARVCKCKPGWTGSDCSIGMCANNCNDHGTCNLEQSAGNGSCVCDPGWKGLACELPNCPRNCNGNPCSSDGKCQCPAGVTTPDCFELGSASSDGIKGSKGAPVDNYDRNVFIGVTVMFLVLCATALVALYITRRAKKAAALSEE